MKFYFYSLFALFILTGCGSTPWAEIDGSYSSKTDNKNFDIIIGGVDGQMYFDNKKMRKLDPGFALIRAVTTKPDRRGRLSSYQSFPIITKPCTKYFISAQHESGLRGDNKVWKIIVDKEEEIVACTKLIEKENNNQNGIDRESE